MVFFRQTVALDLHRSHTGFGEFIAWHGMDARAMSPDETLEALCEAWNMEWEDFADELSSWLEEETEERPAVVWSEAQVSEE